MPESRIDLTLYLSLSECEAKLLFDHCNSTRQSVPDAVRGLILESLTLPGTPVKSIEWAGDDGVPWHENPANFLPAAPANIDPASRRGPTTTTTTTADDDDDDECGGKAPPAPPSQ